MNHEPQTTRRAAVVLDRLLTLRPIQASRKHICIPKHCAEEE
jgi:hypothetical protein